MPSNKKPRRPFDPKRQIKAAHPIVLTEEQKAMLKLATRVAYQAFIDREGSVIHWRRIAERLNVLTALVKRHPQYHDLSHNAALSMVSARTRGEQTGVWEFSAAEAAAVVAAINGCDDLQDELAKDTRGVMTFKKAYKTSAEAGKKLRKAGLIFAPMFGAAQTGAGA